MIGLVLYPEAANFVTTSRSLLVSVGGDRCLASMVCNCHRLSQEIYALSTGG